MAIHNDMARWSMISDREKIKIMAQLRRLYFAKYRKLLPRNISIRVYNERICRCISGEGDSAEFNIMSVFNGQIVAKGRVDKNGVFFAC